MEMYGGDGRTVPSTLPLDFQFQPPLPSDQPFAYQPPPFTPPPGFMPYAGPPLLGVFQVQPAGMQLPPPLPPGINTEGIATDGLEDSRQLVTDATEENHPKKRRKKKHGTEEEEEWKEYKTPTGVSYWYNTKTRVSTWARPTTTKSERIVSWRPVEGSNWRQVTTEDKKTFYYHPITNTSSWTLPEECANLNLGAEVLVDPNSSLAKEEEEQKEDPEEVAKKAQAVAAFKQLLVDKANPLSTWKAELPKIVFDERFKLIPSHAERKRLFEQFVRTRLTEERLEKKQKKHEGLEKFKELLQQQQDDSLAFIEFSAKYEDHPAFQGVSEKERETLYEARMKEVRAEIEKRRMPLKASYLELLRKRGINSSHTLAKALAQIQGESLLREIEEGEKEKWFAEYRDSLVDKVAERKAREARALAERVKQHETAVLEGKRRQEQETKRVLSRRQREEAEELFTALVAEKVHTAEKSYRECRELLRPDTRFEGEGHLTDDIRERIFVEHVNGLLKRRKEQLVSALSKIDAIQLHSTFSDVESALRCDERLGQLDRRELEGLFNDFLAVKKASTFKGFEDLLMKFAHDVISRGELVKFEEQLQIYKVYSDLDCVPEKRTELILKFMADARAGKLSKSEQQLMQERQNAVEREQWQRRGREPKAELLAPAAPESDKPKPAEISKQPVTETLSRFDDSREGRNPPDKDWRALGKQRSHKDRDQGRGARHSRSRSRSLGRRR